MDLLNWFVKSLATVFVTSQCVVSITPSSNTTMNEDDTWRMSRKPNNIPFHFDNLLHYGQTITHGICLFTSIPN